MAFFIFIYYFCLYFLIYKYYIESSAFYLGIDVVLDNRSGADFHNERNMLGQMGKIVHLGIFNLKLLILSRDLGIALFTFLHLFYLLGANNILHGERRSIFKLLRTWWSLKNISIFDLIMANQAVCGFNLDILKEKCPQRFSEAVKDVNALYADKKIQPRIDSVWTFEEVGFSYHYYYFFFFKSWTSKMLLKIYHFK